MFVYKTDLCLCKTIHIYVRRQKMKCIKPNNTTDTWNVAKIMVWKCNNYDAC